MTAASPKVLVVEDEESILELIRDSIGREGFVVATATSGEEALAQVNEEAPDLILLDLMLPGISGLEVCRRLKAQPATADIPVLMLSARDGESDVIAGLEIGADDYLTKPFSPRILAARLRAALRRREGGAQAAERTQVSAGGVTLDRERREVTVDGARLELTYTEFEILWLLAATPGRVFTRPRIVEAARGADAGITERAVDVAIVRLRRKLGPAASRIETVRGVGYRFAD
ncbi:MAG TPA: response regulator transcription factor [bacterium]